jgi:hypothetical protein
LLIRKFLFHEPRHPVYADSPLYSDFLLCRIFESRDEHKAFERGLATLGTALKRRLDQTPLLESLLHQCCRDIRNGDVAAPLYKILCDFVNSSAISRLPTPARLSTLDTTRSFRGSNSDCDDCFSEHGNVCMSSTICQMLSYLQRAAVSLLTAAPGSAISWAARGSPLSPFPFEVPIPQLICSLDVPASTEDQQDRMFAFSVVATFMLVRGRQCIQASAVGSVLTHMYVAQRWGWGYTSTPQDTGER